MAKFDFSALAVSEETTAEYVFAMIPGDPSIIFAPATDANKAFLDERLRLSIERAERTVRLPRGKAAKQTPADLARGIEEDRETDRVLLSRCCAKAWGTAPTDVDGKQPEFSEQECYDFLKALPDYMFDPVRNWASNVYNFVERPDLDGEESRQLGN